MDDYGVDWNYSLNEAVLHLDLTGKTNVTLTLDHTSIGDENTALPVSFSGHYKGDGISLSIADKMKRVKRGAGRISLLMKLQKAAGLMKKMNKAYANYPNNPDKLPNWEKTVLGIVESANFE